jgi:hypothetical protein
MAAVGEHGQLHALGTAVAEQRVDGRADRAARVEDVVDEHHGHALEREVERGRANERLWVPGRLAAAHVDVVAVKGDVELAEGDLRAAQLLDPPPQPLRERHAAGVDPDEGDLGEVGVALHDLVRDPRQRFRDRLGIENDRACRGVRAQSLERACRQSRQSLPWSASQARALRAMLTFDSFPASRDRVKGVLVGAARYTFGRTASASSHSMR